MLYIPKYTHEVSLSGGFILFGGWLRITDNTNPNRKMECYCKFGGIGIGGWTGKGTLGCYTNWDDLYRNTCKFQIHEYEVIGRRHLITFYDAGGAPMGQIERFGSLGSVAWGSAKWSQK